MSEFIARRDDPSKPHLMAVLLSFVAGYLDSYTYLSLFGLFAAQVTGSFVTAGAEFVTSDYGIAGKLIAIAAFLAAAVATTVLIITAREANRAVLPWMLGLETLFLAIFAAILVFGPTVHDARDWHGIVAGLFAAMAMGAQSCRCRNCQTCARPSTIISRIAAIRRTAGYDCCSGTAESRCSSAWASCFAACCCGNWPIPSAMTALRIFSERAC